MNLKKSDRLGTMKASVKPIIDWWPELSGENSEFFKCLNDAVTYHFS